MKQAVYITLFLFAFNIQAQRETLESISAENISTVNINGNAIFKISIETTDSNTISIASRIEGENNEHIILLTETKNNILYISTQYQPLFTDANDKLSAHKVISIELVISVPFDKSIYLSSDIASIIVQGQYDNATIELINGNCVLQDFSGQAIVNTIQGDIMVFTDFAKVNAFTKNGILTSNSLSIGNSKLSLYSINGDITVIKSQ